jgi:hypothetical protein
MDKYVELVHDFSYDFYYDFFYDFSYDFLVGNRIIWKNIFFLKTCKVSNKNTKILATWQNNWES